MIRPGRRMMRCSGIHLREHPAGMSEREETSETPETSRFAFPASEASETPGASRPEFLASPRPETARLRGAAGCILRNPDDRLRARPAARIIGARNERYGSRFFFDSRFAFPRPFSARGSRVSSASRKLELGFPE